MLEIPFHHTFGRLRHTRVAHRLECQRNARRFTQPVPVRNQSQERSNLRSSVLRRPCRQLALHFTDYQGLHLTVSV